MDGPNGAFAADACAFGDPLWDEVELSRGWDFSGGVDEEVVGGVEELLFSFRSRKPAVEPPRPGVSLAVLLWHRSARLYDHGFDDVLFSCLHDLALVSPGLPGVHGYNR